MNNIIERTWKQGCMVGIEDMRGLTFQNEALAHTFKISGVDADGSAIALTGTPAGVMLRADNLDVALTCALSDGCVTASLPAECYDVPGRAEITIYLTEDGHKVCIYAAIVSVNRTSSGTASPGTAADVVDLVNLMQTSVDAAADSATDAAGSATSAAASAATASAAYNVNLLAPNFVQETPYPAGQHVIYDGGYYVLPNGHEADVTWANTSKTQQTVGGELTDLKSALNANGNGTFKTTERTTSTIAENWRLNESDGLCSSNSDYKLMKFTVSAGDVLKVVSDDRFQFQTVASVPSSGSNNRVGNTYSSGEYFLKVPQTATYLIVSTPKTSNAHVYSCKSSVVITDEIKNEAKVSCVTDIRWRNGSAYNTGNATFICPFYVIPSLGADKIAVFADIPLGEGENVYFRLNTVKVDTGEISDVTSSNRIRSDIAKSSGNKTATYELKENEKGFVIQIAKIKTNGDLVDLRITDVDTSKLSICRYYNQVVSSPVLASTDVQWRNGSAFNTGNSNYISFNNIIPTYGANQIAIYADISLNSGEKVKYYLNTFNKSSGIVDESRSYAIRDDEKTVTSDKFIIYDLTNSEKGFAIYVGKENSNDETVPIRITDIDTNKIQINRYYSVKQTIETTEKEVKNSRHIRNGSATPLTILHFSDLHADTAALSRIIEKSADYSNLIDEMICTGDIVGNDGGAIASWWNPDVLTCIGNHDSAKYTSGSGYDWTYYDMAQRDAWYIAPFESNWGITHESGTSYYYKDYTTQKIRLIVMDVMLYTDNGEEAQTQTAWLKNLLANAITNNLHVLIAIHCPHGGATKKICSFSSYGEGTMPTLSDCDTPQTVIDAVAEKIQGGLKFIGYIVGHTHQDNIWDATGDGTQMMYCITCAAVSQTAQWEGSDQFRDSTLDAFNLVTIDTANTLVKIVRGGGTDIDMRMRTRKAICFDYSTGEKIGEVL